MKYISYLVIKETKMNVDSNPYTSGDDEYYCHTEKPVYQLITSKDKGE